MQDKFVCDIRRGADILDKVVNFNKDAPTTNKEQDGLQLLEVMKELVRMPNCKFQDLVKIVEFLNVSLQCGCNYVWFDTGCIDKTRSAELEESIRSMFN